VEQKFFYASPPFWEIFVPLSRSSFAENTQNYIESTYTPQAGLRYSRIYGSRIRDLFLPSQAEVQTKKTLTRGGDILSAKNNWDFSLTNFAMNLFGSQGAYPFFPWYGMDEFQLQNTLSLITKEGEKDMDWTATFHQVVNLIGRNDGQFVFDHTITLTQGDDYSYKGAGGVKYIWKSIMENDFGISYMEKSREAGAYYQHTEKIEITYAREQGFNTYIVAGHETALTLRKGSFIKAEVNLGFGMEQDYSGLSPGYKLLFALGGGISAHFVF
jgi:hypothetical protein